MVNFGAIHQQIPTIWAKVHQVFVSSSNLYHRKLLGEDTPPREYALSSFGHSVPLWNFWRHPDIWASKNVHFGWVKTGLFLHL